MSTNTAEIRVTPQTRPTALASGGDRPGHKRSLRMQTANSMMTGLLSLTLLVVDLSWVHASTDLGPWIPIFKGVDHAVGTNTPGGGGFPDLQVVNALRIDLSDPDVRLFSTPPITNYLADSRETAGFTVRDFL